MSHPAFSLLCHRCQTVFQPSLVGALQSEALVRCPSCRWEAPAQEFGDGANVVQKKMPVPATEARSDDPPFRIKGKWLIFDCPHCGFPQKMKAGEADASLLDCGHCGMEILPPDLEKGMPAQLTRASVEQLASLSQMNVRAVRLGSGKSGSGDSPVARGARREEDAPVDVEVVEDVSAKEPVPEVSGFEPETEVAPEDRRAVKPLDAAQLGQAFKSFDDELWDASPEWDQAREPAETVPSADPMSSIKAAHVVRMALIVGIVFLVGIALFTRMELARSSEDAAENEANTKALLAEQRAEERRNDEAFALARQIVALPDWRGMLPFVRHRDRVAPAMERFYGANRHTPRQLASYHAPLAVKVAGNDYRQISVTDAKGGTRIVAFETDPGGALKFDWEVFEDVAAWEWQSFKEIRPETPRRLRFAIIRASAAERYFMDARIPRDDGMAVRIWLRDRADSLMAILSRESEMAKEIERTANWEVGKLVIGDLRYPAGSRVEDRVELVGIHQERWVYETE